MTLIDTSNSPHQFDRVVMVPCSPTAAELEKARRRRWSIHGDADISPNGVRNLLGEDSGQYIVRIHGDKELFTEFNDCLNDFYRLETIGSNEGDVPSVTLFRRANTWVKLRYIHCRDSSEWRDEVYYRLDYHDHGGNRKQQRFPSSDSTTHKSLRDGQTWWTENKINFDGGSCFLWVYDKDDVTEDDLLFKWEWIGVQPNRPWQYRRQDLSGGSYEISYFGEG